VDTETPRPEKLVVDFDTTVNSSPTDISGKGNHGTFYGTAQYSAPDKAFSFDGNSDYIKATTNLGSGDINVSVSVWLKLNTMSSTMSPFFIGVDASGQGGLGVDFNINGSSLVWFTTNGSTISLSNWDTYIPLNTWTHLIFEHNTGGLKKLYINGISRGTSTSSTNLSLGSNPTLYIGNRISTNYFDGKISNFKLYNVALEPSEVKKLYNLGRTGRSMVISDTAVGIGKVPEAQLDVRGNISCDGVFKSKNPIAFEAYYTDGTLSTTGTYLPNYVRYNYGGCYEQSTGRFNAPINGIYAFHWHAYTNQGDSTSRIFIDVNGSDRGQKGNTVQDMGQQLSFSIYLNAGDYLIIKGKSAYPLYFHGHLNHNMYSGHLVIAM
jgi:hypothetical protein